MLEPVPSFPGVIGYPARLRGPTNRDRWLEVLLTLTVVLNLVDAGLTLYAVHTGIAVEVNPLMEELLAHGPIVFVVGKLVMVSLGVLLLWRFRKLQTALIASFATFITYSLVCAWHLKGLGL